MAAEVSDEDNPMLLKKPKKDPLDFSDVPSSIPISQWLQKANPMAKLKRVWDRLHPVVRIKDLNNPRGDDEARPKKPAIEIGIGGTF